MNKMKKLLLLLLCLPLLFSSCSSPHDKPKKQENIKDDWLVELESMSEDELDSAYEIVKKQTEDLQKWQDAVREKGNIIYEYAYDIPLTREKMLALEKQPLLNRYLFEYIINIKFLSDTAITMRSNSDVWQYSINSIEESTNDKFSVLAYGGNIRFKKGYYRIEFSAGIVNVVRLSLKNKSWQLISESAISRFVAEKKRMEELLRGM
jgi:hypothetical protein